MTDQLEQHRAAYRAVLEVLPDSVWISHTDEPNPDWERCEVTMPMDGRPWRCPTCGDPVTIKGLTVKCRDWHEVCQCGARYDEPKAAGCRRRKHRKEENR